MLCKEENVMQGNTAVNDSISKDVSSHLSWSFEEKKKKLRFYFSLRYVLSNLI